MKLRLHHRREFESLEAVPVPRPTTITPVKPGPIDTYNSHPGTGLTPETLLSILREAEKGTPIRQCDLFDDIIETDGHLRGLYDGRIQSSAGKEWVLKSGRPGHPPSDQAAVDLEARLRDTATQVGSGFDDFVEHQLTHPGFGYAGTHLTWDLDRGLIVPLAFTNVAHRRFAAPSAERASEMWLIAGKSASDLVPLTPGLWAITRYKNRNPWSAGLLRTAAWWSLFKRLAIRDWQIFAEMFGLPFTVGFYEEGASLASRQALERSARNIGSDGYAVLSRACELHIVHGREGDSSTVYPLIAKNADEEMSKLFAGGTANTDIGDKGSYAAGEIHESRAHALIKADAKRVQATFTRDISRPFTQWNGYADDAAPPMLKIHIARDSEARARVIQIVGQIMDLDEDQLREEFALRAPAPGKGVRMPAKNPAKEGDDNAPKK